MSEKPHTMAEAFAAFAAAWHTLMAELLSSLRWRDAAEMFREWAAAAEDRRREYRRWKEQT